MKPSEIVISRAEASSSTVPDKRLLAQAYTSARAQQQIIDIELQRSKIMIVDHDGNLVQLKLQLEH
jgi:hypothetical protein